MVKTFILLVLCQMGLQTVSCTDQHDSGVLLQDDSTCTLPEFPVNGRYKFLGATADAHPGAVAPNSTVIQYNCDVGYVPYLHSTAVCIGGRWDTQFTKCQKKITCLLPTSPAYGSYELSDLSSPLLQGTEVPNWTTVIYSCDATFEIVGNRTALCYNGLWTTEPPQCRKTTACVVPDPPIKGSYSILGSQNAPVAGSSVTEFQILKYDCPAPNILQGASIIICLNGNWLPEVPSCLDAPSDCGDVLGDTSGVYRIQPNRNSEPFDVYCDLTLAGQKWTVIQQRFNGDVDFYRGYTEYSDGFGDIQGNHWIGLEHIHEITKGGHHELYVELETHDGTKAYARYETFIVGNSSTGFQLTISGYSGTFDDSMYDTGHSWDNLNGMEFSTFDNDQDRARGNCAKDFQGGWWYNWCTLSNLNGPYRYTAMYGWEAMSWYNNYGYRALKSARMLVRARRK